MAGYLENVLQISNKFEKEIKKLANPLVEMLGIDYVAYQRVSHRGEYAIAINRMDIGEYYLENKIYEFDPFIRSPKFSQTGIILLDDMVEPRYTRYIENIGNTFGLNVALTLVKTTETGVIFLCFCSKKRVANQLSYYLNALSLFQRYFDFFHEEGANLIKVMTNEPINILDFLKEDFYHLPGPMRVEMGLQKRQQFLKVLNQSTSSALSLTAREKQCLLCLLQGSTAKETAQQLHLSHRTIEQFLGRLKIKLDCKRRSDLFKKAQKLKNLNYLEL